MFIDIQGKTRYLPSVLLNSQIYTTVTSRIHSTPCRTCFPDLEKMKDHIREKYSFSSSRKPSRHPVTFTNIESMPRISVKWMSLKNTFL